MMTFKLYIWTSVLCDYGCGLQIAYAESIEDALKLVLKEHIFNEEDIKKYLALILESYENTDRLLKDEEYWDMRFSITGDLYNNKPEIIYNRPYSLGFSGSA